MFFRTKYTLANVGQSLSREELIRRSRILIVDDEEPELIDDLKRIGYAITYESDITPANLGNVERAFFDLVILDFGNVGRQMGNEEGLSILKHLKRTNPSIVVIAYTSKSLPAEHAGFFRMADNVLPKDAGISSSTEKIDEALRKAHSITNVWQAVLASVGVKPGSRRDAELQHLYVRALRNGKYRGRFEQRLLELTPDEETKKVIMQLGLKLLELGVTASLS